MTANRVVTPGQVSPVTLRTEEIRLATTWTGGVSLAVWMGGVAREIDLLTQASNLRRLRGEDKLSLVESDPLRLYLDLLNLLDVTADVDVLSGTSAGGINAALLAYGRAEQADMAPLRDLWLKIGALETLLRDPTDPEVPSLLQGDAQMYAGLCDALRDLPKANHPSPKKISTTLFITTTLLNGEPSRFADTYGTLVHDLNHRGMFRFTQDTLDQTNALALAARSTASFPGAFEPSFLPYADGVPASGPVPARPPVGQLSNITRNHWVADGGLLDNQPIDALLETIFERPARRLVRRILLYIVPTSGPTPDQPATGLPVEQVNQPYPLLRALFKDLGAVLHQSISADLRAIREHNERLGVRTDVRQRLTELAVQCRGDRPADDLLLLPDGLFHDYRTREADQLASQVVPELMRLLSTWPTAPTGSQPEGGGAGRHADPDTSPGQPAGSPPAVPEHWTAALLPGSTLEEQCRTAVHSMLTERWPAKPTDLDSLAGLGRSTYHGAKAIVLSMLRCRFLLAEWGDPDAGPRPTDDLVALLARLHAAFRPYERGDAVAFVHALAARADIQRLPLPAASAEIARRYLDAMDVPAPSTLIAEPGLATAWQVIAAEVTELVQAPLPAPMAAEAPAGSRAEQVGAAADHLRGYAEYFAGSVDDRARALRLFALHAAQRAMLPANAQADQPVELIQLSSDTRTLLDLKRDTAASKLTGLQLSHFGAFFKRSWRANDWIWGRLDGAGWLIHLLLAPRRINSIAISKDGSRVSGFLSQLGALGIPDPPAGEGIPVGPPVDGTPQTVSLDSIRAELAFLDDVTQPVPVSLPLTALWVASCRQLAVAVEELPALAETILDPAGNETSSATARNWALSVQHTKPADLAARAPALLAACPVPNETLHTELGTPLMVRTTSKAAAVTAAAVNSMPQMPAPARPFTSTVRTITLAGYRVINLVQAWPRRMILAGLALLLIGALLATGQSTVFGLTGVLIAAVGGYLLVFGAWQTSRAVLAAVLSATVVGGAASLTIPSVRRGLFGVKGGRSGWLNDRVFWLGQQWWHPLLGLAVVLALLAVLGMLFARRGEPRPPIFELPRWAAVAGAMLIALAVIALLAILLAIKGG
jgi:patatin-related protein